MWGSQALHAARLLRRVVVLRRGDVHELELTGKFLHDRPRLGRGGVGQGPLHEGSADFRGRALDVETLVARAVAVADGIDASRAQSLDSTKPQVTHSSS